MVVELWLWIARHFLRELVELNHVEILIHVPNCLALLIVCLLLLLLVILLWHVGQNSLTSHCKRRILSTNPCCWLRSFGASCSVWTTSIIKFLFWVWIVLHVHSVYSSSKMLRIRIFWIRTKNCWILFWEDDIWWLLFFWRWHNCRNIIDLRKSNVCAQKHRLNLSPNRVSLITSYWVLQQMLVLKWTS